MEQDFVKKEIRQIDRLIAYAVNHAWIKTAVFIVAFLEAVISPILPELVLATVLSYRKDISWKLLSFISALGSALGASVLYTVGKYLYKGNQVFFDKILDASQIVAQAEISLSNNAFMSMIVAAFTPLPDKVFALLSGIFSLSFISVVSAFFIGRLIRAGIVAYFSYHFGDEARAYILKHTKLATIIIVGVLLVYILLKVQGII